MSNITPLMIFAGISLFSLLVSVVLLLGSKRPKIADRARLILLRGLVWAFGAVLAAYLSAQAVLLANSDFQGFTLAACSPAVVFVAATAAAIWHLGNLKRQTALADRRMR